VPLFFDQLIEMLKDSQRTSDEMKASATKHGNDMVRMGFTVAQVVYDYGDVCQAVTELASELDAAITVDEFHTLNRCLHDAIAQAVTEFGRQRERALREQGREHMGVLAHDLRNRLTTALLSLESLRAGDVSIGGSTGALLQHSLTGLNELIDRSLVETRKASTSETRDTGGMADFDGRA
jgi:signal transduction histidine kinase